MWVTAIGYGGAWGGALLRPVPGIVTGDELNCGSAYARDKHQL
jgi:hypothetical protein